MVPKMASTHRTNYSLAKSGVLLLILVPLVAGVDARINSVVTANLWRGPAEHQEKLLRHRNIQTTAGDTEDDRSNSGSNSGSSSGSSSARGLVDLVHLVPFDVQIAVTKDDGIETHEVFNIVTAWMNRAYRDQLQSFGFTEANLYAEFDSVVLFNNDETATTDSNADTDATANESNDKNNNRQLQKSGALFTAKFRGGAVFSRDAVRTRSVPPNDVLLIQQMTLLNDTSLADLFQASSVQGLGSAVVDVNAFLTPKAVDPDNNEENNDTASGGRLGSDLAVVMVGAIAVAGVAFLFLLGAVLWAFRYDRAAAHQADNAFLASNNNGKTTSLHDLSGGNQPDRTDSDTDPESPERIRAIHVGDRPLVNGTTLLPDLLDKDAMVKYPESHMMSMPVHAYPTMIGCGVVGANDDTGYPESVISDSLVSGSVRSGDISTSLSQYYRSGMGKPDYGGSGMLSDAGSVSSMESYGYSLDMDCGMSAVGAPNTTSDNMKNEVDHGDCERIGGLPVEPAANVGDTFATYEMMEDVQIPDLDQELANLDIQLIPPNMEHVNIVNMDIHDNDDVNIDLEDTSMYHSRAQDLLEEYQKQDLADMAEWEQQRPAQLAAFGVKASRPVDLDDPPVVPSSDTVSDVEDNDDKEDEKSNKNSTNDIVKNDTTTK